MIPMATRSVRREAREPSGASATPGASIRVVVNRTGIPADTLRVWERRYGFPKPARRPGGSRLYSEDDVARLRLIHRALEAGYRPGEVVPLPFEELRRVVDLSASAPEPPTRDLGTPGVDGVTAALLADDVARVRALLRAGAVTLGPRGFVTELAQPLAVRVGELWSEGKLDVRHEHLASALLTTQLRLLLGAFDEVEGAPVVVLATLPGEPHVLPLDMVAVYLAASHAAPRLLGADTPPDQIAAAARAMRADAVGLSISPAADTRGVEKHAQALLAELPRRTELWLGGGGAPRLEATGARRIQAWSDLDAALAALRGLRAAG